MEGRARRPTCWTVAHDLVLSINQLQWTTTYLCACICGMAGSPSRQLGSHAVFCVWSRTCVPTLILCICQVCRGTPLLIVSVETMSSGSWSVYKSVVSRLSRLLGADCKLLVDSTVHPRIDLIAPGQAESRTVCSMISSPHFGEKYMYSCMCPCTVHTTMCLKCKEGNIKYTDCNCN